MDIFFISIFALKFWQLEKELLQWNVIILFRLVEKIKGILQLDESQTSLGNLSSESENGSQHAEAGNEDGSSATSDESFERIDSADLADYEDTKAALENDIPSEDIQSLSPSSEEPKDLKSSEWEEQNAPLESTPVSVDQQAPESTSESVVHSATELKPWDRSDLPCWNARLTSLSVL